MPRRSILEERALHSRGISDGSIYRMALGALHAYGATGGTVLDVGCGIGGFGRAANGLFERVVAADVVRHDGLSPDVEFVRIDSEDGRLPFDDGTFDATVSLEVVISIENPRAFARELVRVTRPGGVVVVSMPNQRSILGLMTLVVKGRYQGCLDANYPMGITGLLEIDALRIARECGLDDIAVRYSHRGRIVFTSMTYPAVVSRAFPRACSDNLLVIGRVPA